MKQQDETKTKNDSRPKDKQIRKRKRDQVKEKAAIENPILSEANEKECFEKYDKEGWGRLGHGITQQLKSPGRSGLRLVDIALILTVFDRTIARVEPTLFSQITLEEFSIETGMDSSNIRAALKRLIEREVFIKVKVDKMNYWGLNLQYFKRGDRLPPVGKSPEPGASTQTSKVDAPCDKEGKLPEEKGKITYGQTSQVPENLSENSVPKNLIEESSKESLLSSEFPIDMVARWSAMKTNGENRKIESEKKIFNSLKKEHKDSFVNNCGAVISFLEEVGTPDEKPKKIACPMSWIEFFWETNLERYLSAKKATEAREKAEADRKEEELKRKIEAEEDEKYHREKERDLALLLQNYKTSEDLNTFADQAISAKGE